MSNAVTHRRGDYYGDNSDNLIWEIVEDGSVIAELYVAPSNGLILNVEVIPERRGEGLARALYEAASATMSIYHQPQWHCSEEGHAFALAVGGETMDDEEAALFLNFDLSIFDTE